MVIGTKDEQVNIEKNKEGNSYICYSDQVLGDGETNAISNIIYINPIFRIGGF